MRSSDHVLRAAMARLAWRRLQEFVDHELPAELIAQCLAAPSEDLLLERGYLRINVGGDYPAWASYRMVRMALRGYQMDGELLRYLILRSGLVNPAIFAALSDRNPVQVLTPGVLRERQPSDCCVLAGPRVCVEVVGQAAVSIAARVRSILELGGFVDPQAGKLIRDSFPDGLLGCMTYHLQKWGYLGVQGPTVMLADEDLTNHVSHIPLDAARELHRAGQQALNVVQ